jgi:hypothetical protein
MTNNSTPCPHPSIAQLEQGDKITTQCTKCGKKMKVVKKPDHTEQALEMVSDTSTERERILANALDKAIEMGAKAEAEVERLRAEVTLYKGYTRGFGILHCAAYGEQHFGKKLLHPEHYDLLEKAGCRMDAYKKATLNPTSK